MEKEIETKLCYDVECCDRAEDVVTDVATEEGKKAYLEMQKEDFKKRYARRKNQKLQKEITEKLDAQAKIEALKELGITEEEYSKEFGRVERFRSDCPELSDTDTETYVKRIKEMQARQNEIIEAMCDKEKHKELDRRNMRKIMVTDYLDMEKSKATLLDLISSVYTKHENCLNIVNMRGKSFTGEK